MILHDLFHVVSRCPRYILCYIAENWFPLGQCMCFLIWFQFQEKANNWRKILYNTAWRTFSVGSFRVGIEKITKHNRSSYCVFCQQFWPKIVLKMYTKNPKIILVWDKFCVKSFFFLHKSNLRKAKRKLRSFPIKIERNVNIPIFPVDHQLQLSKLD